MGNRIIVISLGIILSISLIPILANDAFAGPPTTVGDFRCTSNFFSNGEDVTVSVTDQFLTDADAVVNALASSKPCFSGDKEVLVGEGTDSESPFGTNHHLMCYDIEPIPLPEPRFVTITNQFGTFKNVPVVGPANVLCNPADKTDLNSGDTFPSLLNQHWLCYDIDPIDIAPREINFIDQFGENNHQLDVGVTLCNPVTKTDESDQVFPIILPDAHLMGFNILSSNPSSNPMINIQFEDQFRDFALSGPFTPKFIFIESEKILLEPVGGTVLSPDSVSLLLLEAGSSAVWWLPAVVIAGAGIALFKIKKKN